MVEKKFCFFQCMRLVVRLRVVLYSLPATTSGMSVDSFMSARLLCQRRRPRPSFLLLVLCIALYIQQCAAHVHTLYGLCTIRQNYVCMYVALCRAAQQRQEDLYTNVEEGRGIILLGFLNAAVESADLHFGYHCNRWFLISGRSLPSPKEVVYVGARA